MTTAWIHVNCPTCEWLTEGPFATMEPSEVAPATSMTECCNRMLCEKHHGEWCERFTCFYCGE